MGYRIDAAGRIASELAVGAEPLLQLADLKALQAPAGSEKRNGSAHKGKQARSVAGPQPAEPQRTEGRRASRRSFGCRAWTAANCRWPIFGAGACCWSSPIPTAAPATNWRRDCRSCTGSGPTCKCSMISRRDAEATAAKAAALGLSFPIVMQKQWEISLQVRDVRHAHRLSDRRAGDHRPRRRRGSRADSGAGRRAGALLPPRSNRPQRKGGSLGHLNCTFHEPLSSTRKVRTMTHHWDEFSKSLAESPFPAANRCACSEPPWPVLSWARWGRESPGPAAPTRARPSAGVATRNSRTPAWRPATHATKTRTASAAPAGAMSAVPSPVPMRAARALTGSASTGALKARSSATESVPR